jgi:phosphoribosyl 1,2-cyclic phosphodiesterase
MIAISLQSGSNGNCIYLEAGGMRLLFDAGISGSRARKRLASHNRDINEVDALIVSHDHSDHVRSAGIYHRMFEIPLYMTRGTAEQSRTGLGRIGGIHQFAAGQELSFGPLRVETWPTPHDAPDGVVFVVSHGNKRLGILTDLGHPFEELAGILAELDAVIIESNYDPDMLEFGPYPPFLKNRIRGPRGHVSNREAARLLRDCASSRLQWACLGHLSEKNNRPELALGTHREALGDALPLLVAGRYGVSPVLTVD